MQLTKTFKIPGRWIAGFTALLFMTTLGFSGCGGGSATQTRSHPAPRAEAPPVRQSTPLPKPEPVPQAQPRAVNPSPPAIGALEPEPPTPVPPEPEMRPVPKPRPVAPPPTRSPAPRTQTAQRDNSLDVLLGKSPNMSVQESSSATSIRGLSPLSKEYGRQQGLAGDTLDAVRQMEQFQVSPSEIQRFLREGGLRPGSR